MQVGWIDFSPQERSRTLTILNALQEPGSVDELGVGIVRDAMAARFFPGTSTLLTKARYFFLTPYLMKSMERGHDKKPRPRGALRSEYQDLERKCAESLLANESDREGIIGRASLPRGKWVTRGPGELYWAPLRALGFMRPYAPDSFADYFSYLTRVRAQDNMLQHEDGDGDTGLSDDAEPLTSVWNIPAECWKAWENAWADWNKNASIKLTSAEAIYLKSQITKSQPDSLFALLLEDEELRTIALAVGTDDNDDYFGTSESRFHDFLAAASIPAIQHRSSELSYLCELADQFSEFILGCRIVYNMQLSGQEEASEKAWERYEPQSKNTAANLDIDEVGAALRLLGHGGFLSLREFVLHARAAMVNGDLDALKQIVASRERRLKGARAKIGRTDLGDLGWRGGMRLPYRFNYAVSIIREIDEAGGFGA